MRARAIRGRKTKVIVQSVQDEKINDFRWRWFACLNLVPVIPKPSCHLCKLACHSL
jgi:hypothetical protein